MTTIHIYKDKSGDFRWRAVRKGRVVADSGEGYRRKVTLVKTVRNIFTSPFDFAKAVVDYTK